MKIRNGFVSNSSSSSFIVSASEKTAAELEGLTLYKVSDMLAKLAPIGELIEKGVNWDEDGDDFPFFIGYEIQYLDLPYYKRLQELEERKPGCYISAPHDRDDAYRQGIDYEVFEGDL